MVISSLKLKNYASKMKMEGLYIFIDPTAAAALNVYSPRNQNKKIKGLKLNSVVMHGINSNVKLG